MASMLPTISEGFGDASLRGRYAISRIGWGGWQQSAGIGIFDFDGNGGWRGRLIVNVPATDPAAGFGARAEIHATLEGSYTVDADGSGYGSTRALLRLDTGSSSEVTTTLLITRAEEVDGVKVAQEVSLMEDAVDPRTGGLHMLQATRHPDGGAFSLASFRGTYGGPGLGRGGLTPAAAIGVGAVNFRGDGTFTAVDIQNLAGPLFTERRNATFDTEDGRYTVEEDGIGTIVAPGGRANLVVSRARVDGGVKVCLEYVFVTFDLHPTTGNLVTTTVSKRLP